MASPEELNKQKETVSELNQEYQELNSNLAGIAGAIATLTKNTEFFDEATRKVATKFSGDLTKATNSLIRDNKELLLLQEKQNKGQKLSSDEQKKLAKLGQRITKSRKVAEEAVNNLRLEGVNITAEQELYLEELIDKNQQIADNVDKVNTEMLVQRGLSGALVDNFKEYLNKIDKSGLSAKLLNGELSATQKLTLASEAALLGFVNGAVQGSQNIADLQKNLGISADSALDLQNGLALAAFESEKLFITSKELGIAFEELTKQTGLVGDFGGETLVTFSTLTQQLGLSAEEAGKLTMLSRIQGKNTEDILDNTVRTVGSLVKQSGVAVNVKGVLSDVANVSDAIAVSLGKNPQLIAEAATEARLFGSNLEQVDRIAGSLLDFEQSIASELEAELLTGQQLNLEKARLLALNNDLAGLSQELANNEGIIEAFATGNRIQQEAAASALGLQRDELAKIALQQDYNNMSAEQFKNTYGDVTYESLQAQSATEKFADAVEKIQGLIGDIATLFAPIVDGFANLVGYISSSKVGLGALAVIASGLASLSLVNSIASIFTSFAQIPFGVGIPLAIGATAGLLATIASAKSSAQQVNDGIAPPGNGPFTITDAYGATAITAAGDGVAVSPNISSGGNNMEQKRTNMLLERLLAKDININMDGRKLNDSMSVSGVAYNVGN